ncbi:MAG: MATE family efflux transporter [Oscillospiraceae bacterium]
MSSAFSMDMCSGPILRKMIIYTLPLMASGVLQLLFNAADIIVVGKFAGNAALGAVGSTTALINLITNLFIGLSVGANVAAARYAGAGQKEELSHTVHTSMLLSVICGLVLTAAGIPMARLLLTLMQTPDTILGLATDYLTIYFCGMTFMMIFNFGNAILRAIGDTRRPLIILVISGIVNVILNLIFVILFKMSVSGVALATVISQGVSAFLIVRILINEPEDSGITLYLRKLKIYRSKLILIARIGLPAGFQGTIFSLSNVVIQSSINLFGETVVAGNSAASSIEGFVYIAMNSWYQSTLSFTSQNIGACRYERITKILLSGLLCVTVTWAVLGLGVVALSKPLLGIYTSGAEAIDAGAQRLLVVSGTYALCGIMDVLVGGIRGLGYSVMPMIVSLLGACGLRLVWLATVFNIEEYHTPFTVYASYPVSWFVTILAHIVCYVIIRAILKKKTRKQNSEN